MWRKSLVVVTGKGGVGKTTVSAALALAHVRDGMRVLVAEVAAKDDVARVLGGTGAAGGYAERAVADRVHHVSIDSDHALKEYLSGHLPLGGLAGLLPRTRLFSLLTAATPGLAELLTVGKVWELASSDRHDVVVLDAPATGHALALLEAPGRFAAAAHAGPIARQAGVIDAFLRDRRRTGIVVVTTAEELPVNETLNLRERLSTGLEAPVDEVLVNAVYPRRFSAAEVRVLEASPASAARRAALFSASRARRHRAQVRRLRASLGAEVPVRTLPYVFENTSVPAALARRLHP